MIFVFGMWVAMLSWFGLFVVNGTTHNGKPLPGYWTDILVVLLLMGLTLMAVSVSLWLARVLP